MLPHIMLYTGHFDCFCDSLSPCVQKVAYLNVAYFLCILKICFIDEISNTDTNGEDNRKRGISMSTEMYMR